MNLDLATTYDWIQAELAEPRGVGDTVRRVIARCRDAYPHPDWEELARLPYDDIRPLQDWLMHVFEDHPPQTPPAGLWFGLFNPTYGADLYVCSSARFDSDPSSNEWAVGPEWWPEGRYAHSDILARIYQIAYRRDGLANNAEYPLCLTYGAAAVRELLCSPASQSFLRHCNKSGVAVGFDSGDFILLGCFTETGLVRFE